ncbi:uncharacterized protein LOC100370025 [Saccoglossus kowalevskii]|uniref:Uncharacterized protein LOC100370025 n=1 Tax=Saccoglossus kowalevskii TaxID=10224 RepID=A0ABM0GVK8_SACKO|nr:PREDICTED: uncharacterized protein LOC100370025 [Saccoglossus kowalevskii]
MKITLVLFLSAIVCVAIAEHAERSDKLAKIKEAVARGHSLTPEQTAILEHRKKERLTGSELRIKSASDDRKVLAKQRMEEMAMIKKLELSPEEKKEKMRRLREDNRRTKKPVPVAR